jgi:hypothetical protein
MAEEFGILVSIGDYIGESIFHYAHGSIQLLAFKTYWNDGLLTPLAPTFTNP